MPTYVYKCPKCSTLVELVRSVKDHSDSRPLCVADGCDGQQIMESVLHPAGLVFKGSGWTPRGS